MSVSEVEAVALLNDLLACDIAARAEELEVEIFSLPLSALGFDSLSAMEFAIRLEEEASLLINPSGFSLVPGTTLGDLLNYINA